MSILHGNLPCAQNFFRLKNNFRKKQGLALRQMGSMGSTEGTAKIASPRIMKNLSVSSPHGSRNASPHSQKSNNSIGAGMAAELQQKGVLGIGKMASTKPKAGFGVSMDIEVEEMGNNEEESKRQPVGAGLSNFSKKKSSQLGLKPGKFSSSNSNLSQGSAIDDACSMDDQDEYLMGENVFDNFAAGLDLSDNKSNHSGGADDNADVFEESIYLKTKKKSCKTYWL